MDQGEPVLVPQWYKSANGSTTNARLNCQSTSSRHSDENGVGVISRTRNGSFGDRDRKSSSLRRSFSSNGSVSGKSQAYSSFRSSSHKRNQEKESVLRDRENRTVFVDNGLDDSWDILGGLRSENEILRRTHSMITERKIDIWPKKLGTAANNGGFSGTSTISALGKTSFEKDFPSLGTEGKPDPIDVADTSFLGLKTAVQSIPVSAPVIIGTSALAELPGNNGTNGHGPSSSLHSAPIGHVSGTSANMLGLNMAEALAQAPSNRNAPQVSIDTQKIEELNLRKCKQLIPVTPSMPKAFTRNIEKTKSKGSRGGELIVPNKAGQQSTTQFINHTTGSSARSDIAKPSQAGNLQVLNREKNAISPTAKEATNIDKVVNPFVLPSSAATHPLKNPTDQKLPSSAQNSFWERKPLTQAQNRNDFFNLLRKKSSANSSAIPEAGPCLDELNMQTQHTTAAHGNDNLPLVSSLDYDMENGNLVNGQINTPEGSEGLSDIGENNFEAVDDPEEEAFLQSLGWDKSVKEEALTKEEIDEFLGKYEKQRPLKISLQPSALPK